MKIRCDTCPLAHNTYPDKVDNYGNHFHICSLTGNMVYTMPRKEKSYSGNGYTRFPPSGCGSFNSIEDARTYAKEHHIRIKEGQDGAVRVFGEDQTDF